MGTKKGAWGKLSLTVLACVLCSVIFGGISSSFAASTISGHVHESNGTTPIQNVHIILLDYSNGFQQAASTDTDAQGAYSVTLPAGHYDVWACATCSHLPYTNKYYPDTRNWSVAAGVTVGEGEVRSDIDFILLDAVPITGTVTDTDGNAVGEATVTLYTGLCKQQMVSRGFTDADGSYFQTALPGETVYISAEPNADLTEGWWSPTGGTASCNSAGTVSVTGPSVSNISFSLSRGGSITGHVYKSDGSAPIQNAPVSATTSSPPYVSRSATTGQDGSYTISGLSAGNYTVRTCAKCNSLPFVDRSNTSVPVIAGQPTTVDFSLSDGVLISGHVADSSDQPISFLLVYAYSNKCDESPQNQVDLFYTNSNGNYNLVVPPGGLIYVHTSTHFGTPSYIPEWWDNAGGTTDCNDAVGIPRVLGEPQTGIDFSLQEESAGSGAIQGHAYKMDGTTAIPGLQLQLYRYDGVGTYYGAGSATTDSSGSYSIIGLSASDNYVLKAYASRSLLYYLDEYYDDKTDLSSATRISVGENQTIENIDFRLEDAVSIEGRVTDTGGQGISGAWVTPYSEQCTGWLNGVNADNDGNYFATVRPGTTVYLRAQSTGSGDNFIPQWYAGAEGTTDCHSAQSVVATQNVSGINISLPLGSSISGFVFENDGSTAIPNLLVDASDFTTGTWGGSARTRPDGSYTISGLPPGSYQVRTYASFSGLSFPDKFYNNVSNYWEATPVVTVVGETRSGITFIMGESAPAGGTISGHVYRSDGATPIQSIQVTAKNTQTLTEWSTSTGQDGSYTLSGLPAGGYEVKTCASCYGLPFLDPPGPSPAVVTAGQTTTIDFSLQEAVTISGRVTSPVGRPIAYPGVTIWAYSERCQGGSYWGGVSTDGNGDYTLTVPAVGEVYLWSSPYSYSNYLDGWWNNTGGTRDCNSAVAVSAGFGENQTAIDFVLEYKNPVAVSGRVVQSDGSTPIGNLQIDATNFDTNQLWASAQTDSQGYYDLTGLPPGTYRIRVCASCGHQLYVDEFYPDTRNHGAAEAVVVADGTTTVINDVVLDAGVSITGKVTDAEGRPIASITVEPWVEKCQQNPPLGGLILGAWSGRTDDNGDFFATVLPGEQVYLSANDWFQNLYVAEWWNGVEGATDCNGATLVSAGATGVNFVLERDTLISGVVKDSDGNPINGTLTPIQVQAVQGDSCGFWQVIRSAPIDSSGRFEIRGLEPAGCGFFGGCWGGGPYLLRTDNLLQSNYVNQWWTYTGGTFNCSAAERTELSRTVQAREFRLGLGESISGSITNADGSAPVTDAEIQVGLITGDPCGQHQHMAWANTSSGVYSVTGVPEGDYYLRFNNLNQSNYVSEWWNGSGNSLNCQDAQPVTIISGVSIENRNAQLQLGGAISGHVYQTDGTTAIENLNVFATDFESNAWRGSSNTAPDGRYTIRGLPAGTYRVRACSSCDNGIYADKFYNDTWFYQEAQPVTVTGVETTQEIDFSLMEGIHIYGSISSTAGQRINGLHVQAFADKCGQYPIAQTETQEMLINNYDLLVPPLGEIYIRACPECNGMNFIGEWYDGTGGSVDCNAATAVPANPGGSQSWIDITLDSGASISGTVRNSNGDPIIGSAIGVSLFMGNPCGQNQFIRGTQTDPATGAYTVSGLSAGNYYLQTWNNGTFYMNEWRSGTGSTSDCSQAQAIPVSAGQAIDEKDFYLHLGGAISGRVTQTDGLTGIGNLHLFIYDDQTGQLVGEIDTAADGSYTMGGLVAGSYRVTACGSCNGMAYSNAPYANPVQVTAGQATFAINFALVPAGSVSGRVVASGGQPIEGLNVQAFSGPCYQNFLGGATTDSNGNYAISGLSSGDVYIRACADCNHQNFISEFWNGDSGAGTIDCNLAAPAAVTAGAVTQNINFSLEAGPARSWYFDISVTNGSLSAGFDLLPGMDPFLSRATLSGPDGFFFQYDLTNDVFQWFSECSYRVAWDHDFTGAVAYGDYTLSLYFTDGAVQTSTRTLVEADPVAVDHNTIDWTVNADGSMDISWAAPAGAPPDQVYQVGIFRDGQRYFTMANLSQTSVHIPADSLRCLENGPESDYEIQVRAYDSGVNARENGTNVPFVYDPSALDNRTVYFEASSFNGNLSLTFKVRPGSRESVAGATVTGLNDFIYNFDLANDWFDMSTESRTNNGWYNRASIQTFPYGTYILTVDFSDGHQEVRTYTLNQVAVTLAETLSFFIFPDGAIRFAWVNAPGATGQKYHVRIRSEDGSREYFRSDFTEGNEWTVFAWDLRALEQGQTYRWFVRASDENVTTVVQSETLTFVYDPFGIAANSLEGPSITAITPDHGPTAGGTEVTISGANFVNGAKVMIGGAEVAVVFVDAATLRITTTAHAGGAVNVAVTNPDFQSATAANAFTFVPGPSIATIVPDHGPAAGATEVTINGANFVNGARVAVDGAEVAAVFVGASTLRFTTTAHAGGAVNVAVTNPDFQSATAANAFTFVPGPSITAIVPDHGPTAGGIDVTITGANFVNGATVTVDGVGVTTVFIDAATLRFTTPAHSAGAVNVVVTNPDNQTATAVNAYSFVLGPSITAITPDHGLISGGTEVTITGANFVNDATVTVDGVGVTTVFIDAVTLRFTTPAHSAGAVNVVVTNPDSQRDTGGFTYLAPAPVITGISHSQGPTAGGTALSITGTNFEIGATVSFGTSAAANVVVSGTQITCTTPLHAAGAVDVVVTNPDGQSETRTGGFTYVAPPSITGITPTQGSTAGGTPVTISGTSFVTGTTVAIGGLAPTGVTVSPTQITCTTPAHEAGAVSVAVTNPDGQSATLASGFTYVAPPSITGVSPSQGTTDGGTSVTITGANFAGGATVTIGGLAPTGVTVSPTQITCTTPAHEAGAVSVAVTNPDGQSATRAGGYIYVAPAPPMAGIVSGAPAEGVTTNRRDYSVTVGGTDVVRYTYRLSQDGGTHWGEWAPILTNPTDGTSVAAPITLNGLGDANQESVTIMLQVCGTNSSNNWQTEPNASQRSWKIDLKPPAELTLSGAPQDGSRAAMSDISVKVGGTDVTHYKYRWDAGAWSNAISVLTSITDLPSGDGAKTLEVLGADAYGNWQTAATSRTWTVDNAVPTAVLSVDPGTPITQGALVSLDNAIFTVGGAGVTHYKHMLETDGLQGDWSDETPVATRISLTGLADNEPDKQYMLYVNARNDNDPPSWQDGGAGVSPGHSTTFNWRVDTSPPSSVSGLSPQLGTPATTSVNLTWNTVENGLKSYRLRYATFEITAANWDTAARIITGITPGAEGTVERYTVTGLLSNTTYYFALRSEDQAGNLSDPLSVSIRTADNRPVINSFSLSEGGGTTGHNGAARELSVVGDNFVLTESGTANTVRFISTQGTGGFSAVTKGVSATFAPYTLTVDVPVGAPSGAYKLQIMNANGTSALSSQAYTITHAPTPVPYVTLIYPISGPDNGATDITITGSNFGDQAGQLTGVTIKSGVADPVILENVVWVNRNKITARVPAGMDRGVYEVRVTVTVAGDPKTNQVSATRFEVYTPVALTGTAVSTDQGVTMPADGIVPAPVSLSTAPKEETSLVGENVAEVAVEIEPGTEITKDGAPYDGTINPPRQVPVSSMHPIQQSKLGSNAVVFTMGIDAGTLQLGQGQAMFVQVQVSVPSGGKKPTVYYLNTQSGAVERAGLNPSAQGATSSYRPKIDWFADTYEKPYQWGGAIISERPDSPEEGFTTYTIGLLLDHMSSYAAGPPEPVITGVAPTSGRASGGDTATITGSNFTADSTVTFGGSAATVVSISPDGTEIMCTTPAHGQGLVDITVTSPGGLSGIMANAFTYNASSQPPYFDGGALDNNQTFTGNITVPAGRVISGNAVAAGVTVTNNGTMIDPTNHGTIVGGRVGGTVTNTGGTLQGVTFTSETALSGGRITGAVAAEGEGAAVTNAVIDATSLTNMTIGSGCTVTQRTVDGNPGLDLTAAVTGPNGVIRMATPILVDADGNTLKTLADLLETEINDFLGDTTCDASGDEAGNTIISSGAMGNVILPSAVTSVVTTDEEDAVSFTETGELRIVEDGFAFTLAPVSADGQSFTAALQGIGAEIAKDRDQVVTVSLSDGVRLVFRFDAFAARPGAAATFAAAGATFSLAGDPADPASYCLLITYPDGTTQHMPPFIHALGDFRDLARQAGVSYRIVPSSGVIELLGAGGAVTYRGRPDYFIAGETGTTVISFESAGDANGDGLVDLYMITPSGKQVIYTLP